MSIKTATAFLNLREIESRVFEKIYYSGEMSASELAREAAISRTSVYDILDALIDKGLIFQSLRGGVKTFSAQPFEKILLLVEEKRRELEQAQIALTALQERRSKKSFSRIPNLQVFEGRPALQQMMKDMLLYRDTHVLSYWPIGKVAELLTKDFFERFHRERIRLGISVDMIWPHEESLHKTLYKHLGKEYFENIRVRIAPKGVNFSLGYTVYGNTVRFISSQKESFGFLIQSTELADMMSGQFRVLWEASKEAKMQ